MHKNKHKIRQVNTIVQCKLTETHQPPAKSYQLRTMYESGHTIPVPWMNEVTPAAYRE